jgi:hypothetical protein
MDVPAIARVAFTSEDRVRDVIRNFNADGFGSLYPKYKGGRPPKFTLPQRREIKKIAKSKPAEHDLPFSAWSLARRRRRGAGAGPAPEYRAESLAGPVRQGRAVTAAGPRLAGCVVPVPARAGIALPGGDAGADLLARFPSRRAAASWPATLATRQQVLSRLLAPPFALDNPASQQCRRLGLVTMMNWLETQPGASHQDRWLGSGAEARGDWRELVTGWKAGHAGTRAAGLLRPAPGCWC